MTGVEFLSFLQVKENLYHESIWKIVTYRKDTRLLQCMKADMQYYLYLCGLKTFKQNYMHRTVT